MKYLKLILFILLSNIKYSQYLPYIGSDQTLSGKQESITLTANLNQCNVDNPHETTDYELTEIPYIEQTNNGINAITEGDGILVGPYNIGFDFCFYGQTYNQIWIGDDGFIKFSPNYESGTSYYIPNPICEKNCIFAAYQDWDIMFGGEIKYEIQGTAPYRKLVISWININLLACYSYGTFHIILYETTNIIETHIKNKPNCYNNTFGLAIQGIHNQNGTQAVAVPGRNFTEWTAQNSSHRWTPSGNETQPTLVWYEVGNPTPVGTGNSITITPPLKGASYTCHLEYPSCFLNWKNLLCSGPDTINIDYEFEDNTILTPYTIEHIAEHSSIDSLIETPEQPAVGSICYIPNSFTPDGNEFNNIFKPVFNGVEIQYFNFTIYNRWGEIIYQSRDYNSYWDGTYNNIVCSTGIYLYEINFKTNDKFYLINGHINLIK